MSNHLKILAALLLLFSTSGWCTTGSIQIGGIEISIPPPPGLQNADPEAPNLIAEASSLYSDARQGTRFLILFVPPKDIVASKAGGAATYSPRYATVLTRMSANDTSVVSLEDFKRMQNSMQKTFDSAPALNTIHEVNENVAAKKLGAEVSDFSKPKVVSKSPHHLTVGMTVNVNQGSKAFTVYGTTTMTLLKGKILILNLYCPPSEKRIRETGIALDQWIKSTLAANGVATP